MCWSFCTTVFFKTTIFFKVKKLRHREDKYPAESLTLETERLKFESEVAGTWLIIFPIVSNFLA